MEFQESGSELDTDRERDDDVDLKDALELDDNLDVDAIPGEETSVSLKEKDKQLGRHTLEVRRAIEEHLERKRLLQEVDYLFDDHFVEDTEK